MDPALPLDGDTFMAMKDVIKARDLLSRASELQGRVRIAREGSVWKLLVQPPGAETEPLEVARSISPDPKYLQPDDRANMAAIAALLNAAPSLFAIMDAGAVLRKTLERVRDAINASGLAASGAHPALMNAVDLATAALNLGE